MQVFAKAPTWLAIMAAPKRDDAIMHAMDPAGVSGDDVSHATCTAHRRPLHRQTVHRRPVHRMCQS